MSRLRVLDQSERSQPPARVVERARARRVASALGEVLVRERVGIDVEERAEKPLLGPGQSVEHAPV